MKKKLINDALPVHGGLRKILLVMRLTVFLCFSFIMGLNASVYSQDTQLKLELELKGKTIRDAFELIEVNSRFRFFYNTDLKDVNRTIDFSTKNSNIESVLDRLFVDSNISYEILGGNLIVLKVNAQQPGSIVKGQVVDEGGLALPGVTVLVKGTTQGTVTNADGEYSLTNIPDNATLVFSFVGMETQEVATEGRNTITVVMEEGSIGIEEVVAVGYGSVRKSDLTGSVTQIKGTELDAFVASNPMLTLSGRAAGVYVKQSTGHPGENVHVRIRGSNSIRGSNEPLYVIDGVPSDPYLLNNSDIESMEILKDASSTAIYGSRGANGVILIKTKSGQAGRTKVNIESRYSFQQLRKKIDLLNVKEYAQLYNVLVDNSPNSDWRFTDEMIASYGEGTDWQDLMFRTAPMQNHTLSFNGGNEKTQFSLSGSIFDQQGIIEYSSYSRYSTRINFHHKINERFNVDFSTILSRTDQTLQSSGGGRLGGSLIAAIVTAPPFIKPYDENGEPTIFYEVYPINSPAMGNPLLYTKLTQGGTVKNDINTSGILSYEFIDGLVLKVHGGFISRDSRTDTYQSIEYTDGGSASVSVVNYTSVLNENTLNYNRKFGEKHTFDFLIGQTYQNFINKGLGGGGKDMLSDITSTYNLGTSGTPGIPSSSYRKSVIMSYLGRINYNYDNILLLTASFRADGASKYSPGNKWGYFPSGAIAWRMKEKTLKDVDFISDLKVRASWGRTGSQAIDEYSTLNVLNPGYTIFGGDIRTVTLAPGTTLPYNLKWETTDQLDFGFDAMFGNGKFRFMADYYKKDTKDLLSIVSLPSSTGFTSSMQNIGSVRNQGLELSVDADILKRNMFSWTFSGNIAFNKNEVVELYKGEDIITGNYNFSAQFKDDIVILREGEPLGTFFGYVEDGYNPGASGALSTIKYKDLNNDGLINVDDKVVVGDPNPDFIFGFNTFIEYKSFSLSAYFQGAYGNEIANVSSIGIYELPYQVNTRKDWLTNYATPENPNAKYPAPEQTNLEMKFSDRFIEDGSYLRLQHLELGYTLQDTKRSAYFFVSGQNIFTLTNYSWWDPEVNSRGGDDIVQGVDHNTYPLAKSYTIGVRLSF
ncbi:SusC/RagA family TonB-linked outer membrane protein [Mariniphaga sediminis]|uniref:SusC/RagA family TonB-linked outer membrane protein n=1 Tax=Mariniphaga sediminis TaxID=1628158 RepID=A0A399CZ06_9BACT|nr:TonB-dependent receptor [Mariniphaga sediminis]RIH64198.1 SusC/RagA family TonB-linked outer membrane protein [Mariniphaga sediminis]RIH66477.1 SusC/RagA family TonB-linked outer membrane protein [Mariniphaga sediminis]